MSDHDEAGGEPAGGKGAPGPELRGDDFVARLVGDPKSPPQTTLLSGYLGASDEEGHTRVYFDPQLSDYVDVPNEDVLHTEESGAEGPLAPTLVWIRRDAQVLHGNAGSARQRAGFFEGRVWRDNVGATAAPAARGWYAPHRRAAPPGDNYPTTNCPVTYFRCPPPQPVNQFGHGGGGAGVNPTVWRSAVDACPSALGCTVAGCHEATFRTPVFDPTFRVRPPFNPALQGSGGGADTVVYGSGGGTDTVFYGSGGGTDTVLYGSAGGSDTVFQGSGGGSDTVFYGSVGGSDTVFYGSGGGTDTVLYGSGVGSDTVYYGSGTGTDTVIYGSGGGADTVFYGSGGGSDTVFHGSGQGSDTVYYGSGAGSDTVYHGSGQGSDTVYYGSGGGADPVYSGSGGGAVGDYRYGQGGGQAFPASRWCPSLGLPCPPRTIAGCRTPVFPCGGPVQSMYAACPPRTWICSATVDACPTRFCPPRW